MAETISLEAEKRVERGKVVKRLRREGRLPAVLYGRGVESAPISVEALDFERAFKQTGENTLIRLVIKGDKGAGDVRNVLIHEVAMDSLAWKPMHVDFYQVRMDEIVRVAVPIVFVGESPAVKNEAGILVKVLQELEVETLPASIPEKIEADISKLATFDDAIYVKDLGVPSGVKVLVDGDTPVVSVQPPRSEEELKAMEEKPVEAVEEVAVETEEKKTERIAAQESAGEKPSVSVETGTSS